MTETLSIILYILGSILLVVLIILGIKLIVVVDKTNKMVDNINDKVNSLNGLFSVIDYTSDKLSLISSKTIDAINAFIKRIFKKKEEDEEE